MSRRQTVNGLGTVTLTLANTLYPVYSVGSLYVKSWTIQAPFGNSGVVTVCDANGNALCQLSAGLACTWLGDNLDNGTAAMTDFSVIQAKSSVAGDTVIVSATEGV